MFKALYKFINWFAGFFQDQGGAASSKRGTLYIFCFFFYLLVKGSLEGKVIDTNILYIITFIILFCVGAITSEILTKMIKDKVDKTPDKPTDTPAK